MDLKILLKMNWVALCMVVLRSASIVAEPPAPNYMFSNYDFPLQTETGYEDFTSQAATPERQVRPTGDDYGYTELSPDDPYNGPAMTMTHSYSPPGSTDLHQASLFGYVGGNKPSPPQYNWLEGLQAPLKVLKAKLSQSRPPPLPPSPSIGGYNTFHESHFKDTLHSYKPYNTLPYKRGNQRKSNFDIFKFWTRPEPTGESHTHHPVRVHAPNPIRGQDVRGHQPLNSMLPPSKLSHSYSPQAPHLTHVTMSFKGHMSPPPVAGIGKRPFGYTPTSYDGTGLATTDYSRRQNIAYPPADLSYGGGYDLGTSHY